MHARRMSRRTRHRTGPGKNTTGRSHRITGSRPVVVGLGQERLIEGCEQQGGMTKKVGSVDPDQDFRGLHDRVDRLSFRKLQVLCRMGRDDRDDLGTSLEGYDDLGVDRALLHHP